MALQVRNLTTVEHMLRLPFRTITHPTYGTVMRMLGSEVPFDIQFQAGQGSDL